MKDFIYKILYENIDQKILSFVKNNYLADQREQLYWYIIFSLEENFPNMKICPEWNNTLILIYKNNLIEYRIEILDLKKIKIISNSNTLYVDVVSFF
ncbi:MAG: hypothetical protein ACRCXT_13900 [Paraclostridium sp.]